VQRFDLTWSASSAVITADMPFVPTLAPPAARAFAETVRVSAPVGVRVVVGVAITVIALGGAGG